MMFLSRFNFKKKKKKIAKGNKHIFQSKKGVGEKYLKKLKLREIPIIMLKNPKFSFKKKNVIWFLNLHKKK